MLIDTYNLTGDAKILDVGCGKAHLLYEMKSLLPKCEGWGFDISEYGVANSPGLIKENVFVHRAEDPYPWNDNYFDLVISLNCLHNLKLFELKY